MAKVEGAPAHGNVAHLLPLTYKRYVSEWLQEDTPSFDYGGFVVGEEQSEAKLLGKSEVSNTICLYDHPLIILGYRCWRAVLRRSLQAVGLHVSDAVRTMYPQAANPTQC
jgi:hypothetical protein